RERWRCDWSGRAAGVGESRLRPAAATDDRRLVVAAAAEAAAAAIATAARGALPRLAHVERPTLEFAAIQRVDRLLCLGCGTHLDEPEAARATGGPIGDDGGGFAVADLGEQRLEVRARRIEREVTDEDLLAHASLLALSRAAENFVAVALANTVRRTDKRTSAA